MSCKTYTFPHTYTAGDTLPAVVCVLDDTDLTGYTITLKLDRPTTALDKAATPTDLANGKFSFIWIATDLVAGYGQEAAIEFETPGGDVETVSGLVLNVEEAIA